MFGNFATAGKNLEAACKAHAYQEEQKAKAAKEKKGGMSDAEITASFDAYLKHFEETGAFSDGRC